jgi:WD40 repeat protein
MISERVGTSLRGYHILERISTGGFSMVYRAFQPGVGREVALKVIHPIFANEPDFIRRFENEAQLIAQLEHPFIVPIFDFWRDPDGAYLVMRAFPNSLRRLIDQEGAVARELAVRITDQVASALAFAHRHQVVHLDIKPDNILLDSDHNAYLSDFGIARVANAETTLITDEAVGSPAYMSPEQLMGGKLSPYTDIYQLGVTVYEMLTGRHPFAGESSTPTKIIMNHLREPLPPLPDELTLADPVLTRATLKDPTDRYDSPLTMVGELRRALLGDTTPTGEIPLVLADFDPSIPLNPYKGLRAFEEIDSANFFGRESLIEQMVARLRADEAYARFLAVVGPSGSGKSSVVRAGLFPALRRDAAASGWFIADMLPGEQPFQQLAAALLSVARAPVPELLPRLRRSSSALIEIVEELLRNVSGELLLFIDQFEEVFTLAQDERERLAFLHLLDTTVRAPQARLRIVVALRADFYDRPLMYEGFGALVQARTQVVLPLTGGEIEQAIVRPANRVGLVVERDLISAVVEDVRDEPGALPLLQYALTEVYERRDGRRLTLAAYQASGGVFGALARRADEVYAGLTPAQQSIARQVMLRLVTLGEGAEDTRRRVRRVELEALGAAAREVLESFGRYRLLTFDHDAATREPTVEIAHEALIRAWGRLRDWLNSGRDDVRMQRALAGLAVEWQKQRREPGFLLLGARLTQFQEWAAQPTVIMTDDERAFLYASVTAAALREQAEAERRARELRLAQDAAASEKRRAELLRSFVRALTVIGVALLIVTSMAGFFAVQSSQNATEAERRANIAQAIALAAQADVELRGTQPDRATLLALEALESYPYTLQGERALTEAVLSNRLQRVWVTESGAVNAVALSRDGLAAAGMQDGSIQVWDVGSGEARFTLAAPMLTTASDHGVTALDFSPDGRLLLSAGRDGSVRMWSAADQRVLWLETHVSVVTSAAFNEDGSQIASVSTDGTLHLRAADTGALLLRIVDERLRGARSLAFSPNGRQVVAISFDRVRIWDMVVGEARLTLVHPGGDINAVDYSPDGRQIVTANADNTLSVWRLGSLDPNAVLTLTGHTAPATSVHYSDNGRYLVSAGDDNTARVWNATTGGLLYTLAGHSGSVRSALFSYDGSTIMTGSFDGTARLWSTRIGFDGQAVAGHGRLVNAVAFSPDGALIASGGYDRMVRLWDVATGVEVRTIRQGDWVNTLTFSPDGRWLISGGRDGIVYIWEAATGDLVREYAEHNGIIDAVAIHPQGRLIASAGTDRAIRIWEADTGATWMVYAQHTAGISSLAFSPNGDELASASFDSTIRIWDVQTGASRLTLSGHEGGVTSLAYSPDGRSLVSGGVDTRVRLWNSADGALIALLIGHGDSVSAVSFSPNSARVVSASDDSTIRVWDLASRQPVVIFSGLTQPVQDAAVRGDGRRIAAGYRDGSVRIWQMWQEVETLRRDAYACCVYRALTETELQLYSLVPIQQPQR